VFFFKAEIVYHKLGLQPIARCLAMNDPEIPASASVLVHNMIMSICDLENRRKIRKPINVPFNFGIEFLFSLSIFFYLQIKSRSIYY
jgi:hypothetical protein